MQNLQEPFPRWMSLQGNIVSYFVCTSTLGLLAIIVVQYQPFVELSSLSIRYNLDRTIVLNEYFNLEVKWSRVEYIYLK